ncbi:MAG: DUF115 domain-containing protein [Treponema sp.]|jgi:hypothetical protein|nr:DUF115 domain-containing protein [Treponema sp.]
MSERIVPAKDGSFTLYKDKTALHSLYNPGLEAEKFIDSLSLESRDYRCFILVEPGLGYMVPALKKKFPSAVLVSLHCSAFFSSPEYALSCRESGAVSWSPGSDRSSVSLEDFLETVLPDTAPDKIRIVEWRPAAAAYGKKFVEILSGTVEVIRRRAANKATIRGFGRRWLRNSFRNLGLLRRPAAPGRIGRPVIVSAAGPSLEEELSVLASLASSPSPPLLIAVSSSLPCLVSAGLVPDLVVATDGGAWALLHLYEAVRLLPGAGKTRDMCFACALSAALPSQIGEYPALILADGSVWQRYLLGSLGLPFAAFPQRGTVSASALDLAFFLGSGPVYISGLDLRHADLRTHCRPYALDRLRDERADRLKPAYSGAFEREAAIRDTKALSIYAAWFKNELAKYPRRIYAVSEGNSLGIPRASIPDETDRPGSKTGFFREAAENIPENAANGVHILLRGLEDPVVGKQIGAELGELLFPDEKNVKKADIESELNLFLPKYQQADQTKPTDKGKETRDRI